MENTARFFVIGDLHIHISNLEETEILGNFLITKAREINPDVIVVLGDVLETNNIIRAEAHVPAIKLLSALSEIAPLLLLMGNHDLPGPLAFLSECHGFSALKKWMGTKRENVHFASGTGVQLVDAVPILFSVNGIYFCAAPYVPPGRFLEALNFCENWQSTAGIFCHQEIATCDTGNGHRSKNGDVWLAEYPHLISGHIHKYQRLAENVLYGGSPRQVAVTEDHYKTVAELVFSGPSTQLGKVRFPYAYQETRISTGLVPRAHFRIYAKEVDTVVVPDTGRVKIEITGTVTENILVRKNPRLREWRRKGFTIKIHDLLEEMPDRPTLNEDLVRSGFKALCRVRAEEEGLNEEYQEIFG